MFWCCGFLSFLLLLGDVYGDVPKNRVRRQVSSVQSGQLIDNIFNIPITAIKQTSVAAQTFLPENTQAINTVFQIPVSTLQAVGTLVKTAREQRQQNADIQRIRQERRDRLSAIKEQNLRRKEEIQKQRLWQQQLKRTVRHHHKDPFGLGALSDLLVGHHGLFNGHHGGLVEHHSGLNGIHGLHGGHGSHGGHGPLLGGHGGHEFLGNRPQNTYEVYEDVNEDTTFSWHGVTAGFGSFYGTRPSNNGIKIENKIAPKEKKQKISKYSNGGVNPQDKVAKIKNKLDREENDPPLEDKIAPRTGKITFLQ